MERWVSVVGLSILSATGCSKALGFDNVSFDPSGQGFGGATILDSAATDTRKTDDSGDSDAPNLDSGPACVPRTCQAEDAACGTISDGCDKTVECGSCPNAGDVCGTDNKCHCGASTTCVAAGAECGQIDDGCGAKLTCPACQGSATCGADNRCQCAPATCQALGAVCGQASNNCGGALQCGNCPGANEVCGSDNKCHCTPSMTCQSAGAECGQITDECGNVLQCPSCVSPKTCGTDHKCTAPTGMNCYKMEDGGFGGDPQGQIPVCCTPSTAMKADIQKMLDLLNQYRIDNGLKSLGTQSDPAAEAAMEAHLYHMAVHSFEPSHYAPEGSDPAVRAEACGTTAGGENIHAGSATPEAAINALKASPGHDANMLNPDVCKVGIAKYVGGPWSVYWGQLFVSCNGGWPI